jgi:hypothetical protein
MTHIEMADTIMEFILVFSIMVLGYAAIDTLVKNWNSKNQTHD